MLLQVCPRCGNGELSQPDGSLLLCKTCGWTSSPKIQKADTGVAKKMALVCLGLVIVVAPIVHYMDQWNGYGSKVVADRIYQTLGMASTADELELADIYSRFHQHARAVEIYKLVIQNKPHEAEAYEKLILLLTRDLDNATLIQAYEMYYTNVPTANPGWRYHYALALAAVGKVDESVAIFEKIINADPKVLEVTAAEQYAQMLIDHGRFQEASAMIKKFQARGENGTSYLNDKLTIIKSAGGARDMASVEKPAH